MSRGHVIGLGSLPGAGKGELAQQLSLLGVEYLHVGTIVRSTARRNSFVPVEETREAYLPFWEQYGRQHGRDWLARIAFKEADKTGSDILLDGVRTVPDAEAIKESDNGTMVWLEADLESVAYRVLTRGRREDVYLSDVDDYMAKMQQELAGEGNFPMGAVRDVSEVFLLPVPEIDDLDERANYYSSVAWQVLQLCQASVPSAT